MLVALNGERRVEASSEGYFTLKDDTGKHKVLLVTHNPGFDFSELDATYWQILSLEGDTNLPNAVVEIDDGTLHVFGAGYLADFHFHYRSDKLAFYTGWDKMSELSFTPPPLFVAFESALHKVETYEVTGNDLIMTDISGNRVILLRRIWPNGLEYRRWHIAAYAINGVLSPTRSRQFQTVRFLHGRMEGTAGCGWLFGNYDLADNILSTKGYSMLIGACWPLSYGENRLVIDALNSVSQLRKDGNHMVLKDADGAVAVVLAPTWQKP